MLYNKHTNFRSEKDKNNREKEFDEEKKQSIQAKRGEH